MYEFTIKAKNPPAGAQEWTINFWDDAINDWRQSEWIPINRSIKLQSDTTVGYFEAETLEPYAAWAVIPFTFEDGKSYIYDFATDEITIEPPVPWGPIALGVVIVGTIFLKK